MNNRFHMNSSIQPVVETARLRWSAYVLITAVVLILSVISVRLQSVTNASSKSSNLVKKPMEQFVFIFRQSRQLSEAEQKQRTAEIVAWLQRQNNEGHQIEPRILGAEKQLVVLEEKQTPSSVNDGGTLVAFNFLQARDFAEAVKIAKSHPGLRYGVTIEVRPWTSPIALQSAPLRDIQHISVYIDRRPAEVYEFASDPRNLPRWAAGLARSEVRKDGDEWVADAPFGKVRVRFAERNAFGVLDHDVKLESGVTIHNPMRVVPNGEGSEFMFTLIRRPGLSDAEFARDKAAVENDLKTLKDLLERKSRS